MQIQVARICIPRQCTRCGCRHQVEPEDVVIEMRRLVEIRDDGTHVTSTCNGTRLRLRRGDDGRSRQASREEERAHYGVPTFAGAVSFRKRETTAPRDTPTRGIHRMFWIPLPCAIAPPIT